MKILWKDWYLMDQQERNEYLKSSDLLECYLDNTTEDIEDYDAEAFEEYCIDYVNECFNDDFGEYGNWKYSPLKDAEFEVQGILGLWNGNKPIIPKRFDNLYKAIQACLSDYNIIYEDQYGNLKITAYHHDGENVFTIKRIVDGKPRCLHFRREVFGCKN